MSEWVKAGFVIVVNLMWVGGFWFFGERKKWREHYPTALFICMWDLIELVLTFDKGLWRYPENLLFHYHVFIDFQIQFLHLIPMTLWYLARYPFGFRWTRQAMYVLAFFLLNGVPEWVFYKLNLITYHNGWNYLWSLGIWLMMLLTIRLHATRVLLAWCVCVACTVFAMWYFHIPLPTPS
ncbi:CBO0543 family protein [Tumebacillus flagellatus]|uniref:Uncharacterized protein n=1 Tax=Tumebacillus flagellatus TaxID=1157490 RepID=A0A074LTT7_9BACL|nr:CBO0543 family protein [Tumebacillus flagellatus]KEO84554.1 hypothetical protein EL26_03275 [Tumebacillus flagellatus]